MNIAIIDIGWRKLSIDSLEKEALGGSESWLMQLSKTFVSDKLAKFNFNVDVYCNTDKEESVGNLHMLPLRDIIKYFLKRPRYDFVILNRIVFRYKTDFIGLIRQYNVTTNIYIQMHDLSMVYEDHLATDYELERMCFNDPRIKGFIFLTPWHAENFYRQYPSLSHIGFYIIPNGVDTTLFSREEKRKDHRLLWSSCAERGLDILLNDVYPLVKKKIEDFGVDVAGYNDLTGINIEGKDVNVLGNLDKMTLYYEMRKHCCWFYPGTFAETFCITMVENMLNENIVISPFTYGTQHIIPDELKIKKLQNTFFQKGSKEYFEACREAADHIVEAMNNYDKYTDNVQACRQYCERYTWLNTAMNYLDVQSLETCRNVPITHELKGVFLSQSCNKDFFKKESELVEQTWAKELLDGSHPGYEYFRYTSCDEAHPEPCIDGHIIYVAAEDDLAHTYEKMRDAYKILLKNGYKFNKIFRTNTSTFVNVPMAIARMEASKNNEIVSDICGYYHKYPDGSIRFQFNCFTGNAYIISDEVANKIFTSNFDSSISPIPDGDDIITNMIINEIYDPGEIIFSMLNNTGELLQDRCYNYKSLVHPEQEEDFERKNRHAEDPNIVNKYTTVSYRVKVLDFTEREKYGELEHLKELYKAYAL